MCCSILGGIAAMGLPFLLFNGFWVFDYRLMILFTTVAGWVVHFVIGKGREYFEYLRLQRITQQKQRERAAQLQILKSQYPLTPTRQALVQKSPSELIVLL